MIRLLLSVPDPAPAELLVTGERFHYLAHVLRAETDEVLEVFDGKGRAFEARVLAMEVEQAKVALGPARPQSTGRSVTLVQGLPKGDKLEWVLQKGTELGATAFAPVAMVRSVVKLDEGRSENRHRRWVKIVEEAARQCGRADVPTVMPGQRLLEAIRALPAGTVVWVLDEQEKALSLGGAFLRLERADTPVAVVIGPEGGIDRSEVLALCSLGAQAVSLGPRILRTETAGMVALAVLQHLDGQLG